MKQKHNTLCCSWKDRVWTMLKCSAKKQTPCSVCLRSALNSWHEEKSCGTKGSNHVAPAYPPGTWIQLTAERRWSEGGFQPVRVCACVRVPARACVPPWVCAQVNVFFHLCDTRCHTTSSSLCSVRSHHVLTLEKLLISNWLLEHFTD